MEVRAIAKSVRISPRKLRLVVDAVRDLPIDEAFRVLEVAQQRAAKTVVKTLNSAIANATNNAKLDRKNLFIGSVMVNEAPALKRFHPSTRGRIHAYKKRGSHLTIILKEKVVPSVVAAGSKVNTSGASTKADEAVAAAIYGGKEEKKTGVKALASRLTGRNKKTEEKKEAKK